MFLGRVARMAPKRAVAAASALESVSEWTALTRRTRMALVLAPQVLAPQVLARRPATDASCRWPIRAAWAASELAVVECRQRTGGRVACKARREGEPSGAAAALPSRAQGHAHPRGRR